MWFQSSQKKNANPTHAGGVVYRENNGLKEYLLVSARRFSFMWVLPKGHVKSWESEEQAALREVKEESGIKASLCLKIGNTKRLRWNLNVQVVAFYLMEFVSVSAKNKENRKILWLPLDKAITRLFYGDQKKILKALKTISST